MFRHLLVPTDGSVLSDSAVNRAVSFAKEAGARITFFYALPAVDGSIYGEAELLRVTDPESFAKRRHAQAHEILSRATTAANAADVPSNARSAPAAEPFEAIIAVAEEFDCDLILMASHGHRGIKGLLLGSQTQKVLVHSKTPVLVYR